MKSITAILFVVAALLLSLAPAATAAPPERSSYIVVLHDDEPSPAAAARDIAAQLGLAAQPVVATGAEVEATPDHALPALAARTDVFARTSPSTSCAWCARCKARARWWR